MDAGADKPPDRHAARIGGKGTGLSGGRVTKSMAAFILRRLLFILPMALLVVSVTWGLIRVAPGNFYSDERALPPAIEENIKRKYGLDRPWYEQYFTMLGNVTCRTVAADEPSNSGLRFGLFGAQFKCFDFGTSLKFLDRTVNEVIAQHLPYSATIGILAYLLALAVGLIFGNVAALKQNSAWDYSSMTGAMLGLSVPNFVLGPILVIVFSLWLYILPPARWGGF